MASFNKKLYSNVLYVMNRHEVSLVSLRTVHPPPPPTRFQCILLRVSYGKNFTKPVPCILLKKDKKNTEDIVLRYLATANLHQNLGSPQEIFPVGAAPLPCVTSSGVGFTNI